MWHFETRCEKVYCSPLLLDTLDDFISLEYWSWKWSDYAITDFVFFLIIEGVSSPDNRIYLVKKKGFYDWNFHHFLWYIKISLINYVLI